MIKKIELLNSEGPILNLYKKTKFLLEFKQENEIIEIDEEHLKMFINGEIDIETKKGKIWNYKNFSDGMKPEKNSIIEFINN
jgi:hypothetical protein